MALETPKLIENFGKFRAIFRLLFCLLFVAPNSALAIEQYFDAMTPDLNSASQIPSECQTDGYEIHSFRIIDGDTFAFRIFLDGDYREIIVRLAGVSAVEKKQDSPECQAQADLAINKLTELLSKAKKVRICSPTGGEEIPIIVWGRLGAHVEITISEEQPNGSEKLATYDLTELMLEAQVLSLDQRPRYFRFQKSNWPSGLTPSPECESK